MVGDPIHRPKEEKWKLQAWSCEQPSRRVTHLQGPSGHRGHGGANTKVDFKPFVKGGPIMAFQPLNDN